MTKLIRVFVFTFVVFAIYFSFEQLAFKNTILAETNQICCNNAGYCQAKECSQVSQVKYYETPTICEEDEPTTCGECLSLLHAELVCLPYGYPDLPYCMNNGYKIYWGKYTLPKPPQGLTTSWVNGNEETGNPHIDWIANGEPDMDHYEIWKKIDNLLSPDVNWFRKANSITNSYTDYSEVGWGQQGPIRTVFYKLKAVNQSLKRSDYSSTVNFTCDDDNFYKRNFNSDQHEITLLNNQLNNNYPNPFNPTTTITYSISEQTFVKVIVYDILGKEVSLLVNEEQSKGNYYVVFDATNLPSGTYYYQITTKSFTDIKIMKLVK